VYQFVGKVIGAIPSIDLARLIVFSTYALQADVLR
jgi:hypothetical protein